MPAFHLKDDPVSAALNRNLSSTKHRIKMCDISSNSSYNNNNSIIDGNLNRITSASEILSINIKYNLEDESISPIGICTKLKEKYTVFSEINSQNNAISSTTDCIPSSSTSRLNNITNTTAIDNKKNQQHQQSIVNSHQQQSSSKVTNGISDTLPSPKKVLYPPNQQSIVNTHQQQSSSKVTNSISDTLPSPKKVLYPPHLISLGWKGHVPIGAGFINLGNTCYLNSILQALFHVPAFVNWLKSDTMHTSQCESINGMTHSECIVCAMVKILNTSHKNTGSAIKPLNIYGRLKEICKHLMHGHQEDAHEFLRFLLEGMEKSYLHIGGASKLDSYSKETTPLNQIFGGYIRTEVCCLECGHISTTFQHFQDLLLDIRQATSLEDALDSYFSRERIGDDGDQDYMCSQCERKAAATKKFSLEKPPKALCIQLKRFNGMGGKNNKHVNVRQILDMAKYIHKSQLINSSLKYKLVSLVNHLGQTSNCGHYTAIGQSAAGSYYHFDDSVVKPVSLQQVLSASAYILMYELMEPSSDMICEKVSIINNSNNNIKITPDVRPIEKAEEVSLNNDKILDGKSNSESKLPVKPTQSSERPAVRPDNSGSTTSTSPKMNKNNNNNNTKDNGKPSTTSKSPSGQVANGECSSLVPYLSESSESESGFDSNPTKYSTNNNDKEVKDNREDKNGKESLTTMSDQTASFSQKKGTGNWLMSSKMKEEEIGKTNSASGTWSVVRSRRRKQWKKSNKSLGDDKKVTTASMSPSTVTPSTSPSTLPTARITSPGEVDNNIGKSDSNKNQSPSGPSASTSTTAASSTSSSSSTMQLLMDMSHQGYGTSNVNSWDGTKSKMNRDLEKDRTQMKRTYVSHDDDLDRGKIKKKRYHKNSNTENDINNTWNRMQEFQNRKNNWSNPLNASSRQNFYRQYTYDKSKRHGHHHNNNNNNNNHHHHHSYRGIGNGGNYHRGAGGGNGFSLSMMSPSILYKKPHCA